MKFIVTGGAGFIGSHLAEKLLDMGHDVIVVDNLSTGKIENLSVAKTHRKLQIVHGDIRDKPLLKRIMEGADGVYHEAALVSVPQSIADPAACFENNALGTQYVLDAARLSGVRRVIFASSAAVYGEASRIPVDEMAPAQPISPYALDKLYGEWLGALYYQLYGLETCALRYFNVYGPRQDPSSPYAGVISVFVDALLQARPVTIYGDGQQSRDFVYVLDVVNANVKAMFKPYTGFHAYNVGTGQAKSINYLYQALCGILRVTYRDPIYQPFRKGDILHSLANPQKIAEELGFKAAWELSQGLRAWLEGSIK